MENKVKNKVKKRLAIYGTMFLLGTSSLNLVGCSDQIVKEPTKIEISNEEETLSTNEVIENEVSENSVVSNNTVSENIIEEEGPIFTKSLTEEELAEIGVPVFNELTNNPPVDGIYNPDYDFSKSDSIYKNDKNYQREVLKERTEATTAAAVYKSKEEGRDYIGIDCKKGFTISSATDSLSIITLNDNLGEYYIIKDYKGEDIILKDSYLDFCTGDKLEENITNFNVTSMNDYMIKYRDASGFKSGIFYILDYTDFAVAQYKNIGKAK